MKKQSAREAKPLWAWTLLALAALLVIAVRLRLASFPLERDEGEYAWIGSGLLNGIAPYLHAYTMKMPGIDTVYALAMAMGGRSVTAIRVALLLANLLTMGAIVAIGRRLWDDAAGAVAAAAYGVMALSISLMGFAAHATHFVVLFVVAGLLLLLRERWFTAGILFGVAITMKQHGAAFALMPLVLRRNERKWGLPPVLFIAGVLTPLAVLAVALAAAGAFPKFWFWNVIYASSYARGSTLAEGVANLAYQLRLMAPLAGFAVVAAGGFIASRNRLVLALLAASVLAILPGLYFRNHYFIQMLPAVALAVGIGVAVAARRFGSGAGVALFVACAGLSIGHDATLLFSASPVAFSRTVYGSNPFPEAVDVAAWIRAHTAPTDTIAVLGSEPEIYFYAGRPAATGYLYMYGLLEEQPHAQAMQTEMTAEIEAAKPTIIVAVNVSLSWLLREGSVNKIFAWAENYIALDYDEVGLVEIGEGASKPIWGADAAGTIPGAENYLLIYRRKPGV
ncbi:MAG TPA: glycosyltransferase family 87 protein [Candidatus Polarisedimenticolaceae bacterium]|nr:glycosyltransferase family 87 protein [Candidatus Polarisedimenticolaceae bacterium]